MNICPLNTGECKGFILPKVKTAFIMAPSAIYQTDEVKDVIEKINDRLSAIKYKIIDGAKLIRHGDYFCSICETAQGCALGIAITYEGLPIKTISNIYLETGIMQGFGKPVILFVDKKKSLPSDYIRHYAIYFNKSDYLKNYISLLDDIIKLPERLYKYVGDYALNAGDYEKAAKYYQEAYLINPKKEIKTNLETIVLKLENNKGIPVTYKERLIKNIRYFCSNI
jgi:tetratricopeptide (TPR) repeat protein